MRKICNIYFIKYRKISSCQKLIINFNKITKNNYLKRLYFNRIGPNWWETKLDLNPYAITIFIINLSINFIEIAGWLVIGVLWVPTMEIPDSSCIFLVVGCLKVWMLNLSPASASIIRQFQFLLCPRISLHHIQMPILTFNLTFCPYDNLSFLHHRAINFQRSISTSIQHLVLIPFWKLGGVKATPLTPARSEFNIRPQT